MSTETGRRMPRSDPRLPVASPVQRPLAASVNGSAPACEARATKARLRVASPVQLAIATLTNGKAWRQVRLPVALTLLLPVVACTGGGAQTARTATPGSSAAATSPTHTEPASSMPLVLAMHPTRQPLDVSQSTAERVVAGDLTDWSELGAAAGRLRLVAGPTVAGVPPASRRSEDSAAVTAASRDRRVLAVVPVAAVNPSVQIIRVDGRDPLRDPAAYPLKTAGAAPADVLTMSAVGDLMLARRVGRAIAADGDFGGPLRPTSRWLAAADVTVGNLESSLSRLGRPRQGSDSFGADPRILRGLTAAGFDVLSLANNHVGDYGTRSLIETVKRIRGAKIVTVGAGANTPQAWRPAIIERDGVRFGFLAFNAIGESPPARRSEPGVVQLRMQPRLGKLSAGDLDAMRDAIQQLRPEVDVLTVLPHWGQQYTSEPVADQRTVARALVNAGADLVIGSHPHWVQGAEIYHGKLIAYSLGNYVFDMDFSRQTQEGVILEVVLWAGQMKAARFVPVKIGGDFAPRVLSTRAGRPILQQIWDASGPPYNTG
jgi:poly-gamma-glutamate capsule biosynthesis protein CapA/YwtB (metallophosphatase superfamily)